MSLWMVRAGRHGEFEDRFLSDSRIYLTWAELGESAGRASSRSDIADTLRGLWPNAAEGKVRNHAGQIWAFLNEMKPGDLVVVPSKKKQELHFGEITGDVVFDSQGAESYRHWRPVRWIADIPRSAMDKDLLYSLGAIMTICEISRNDAETRIRKMLKQPTTVDASKEKTLIATTDDSERPVDYEELARDEIASLIIRRFKGHDLERLVDAILRAQGYVTHHSPTGADKGVDILAGSGPLGFGSPRLCVQVKSEQTPVDHPTFSQLLGTMQAVGADQGLLVSWGGFKSSIDREVPRTFFKVRFWDQAKLLEELFQNYDKLDEEIRAEIPLKRIWTLVPADNEDAD